MNHDLGEVRMKKLSEDQVGAWTPLSPEFPSIAFGRSTSCPSTQPSHRCYGSREVGTGYQYLGPNFIAMPYTSFGFPLHLQSLVSCFGLHSGSAADLPSDPLCLHRLRWCSSLARRSLPWSQTSWRRPH